MTCAESECRRHDRASYSNTNRGLYGRLDFFGIRGFQTETSLAGEVFRSGELSKHPPKQKKFGWGTRQVIRFVQCPQYELIGN